MIDYSLDSTINTSNKNHKQLYHSKQNDTDKKVDIKWSNKSQVYVGRAGKLQSPIRWVYGGKGWWTAYYNITIIQIIIIIIIIFFIKRTYNIKCFYVSGGTMNNSLNTSL